MADQKPSIIFFGNERLATGVKDAPPRTLNKLIDAEYRIEAVISRGNQAVDATAREHSIPLPNPRNRKDLVDMTTRHRADLAVLVAFGEIVPADLIDHF